MRTPNLKIRVLLYCMHTHSFTHKYPSHKQPTHMNCQPLNMLLFNSRLPLILKLIKLFMLSMKHIWYTQLPCHSDWECGLSPTKCWNVVYRSQTATFILTENTNNLHIHMLVLISMVMVSTAVICLTKFCYVKWLKYNLHLPLAVWSLIHTSLLWLLAFICHLLQVCT